MGLLDHLETQLERQIPAQLQAALQQALDDYQPLCDHCRLACTATIATPAPLPPVTAKSASRSRVPLRAVSPHGWRHNAAGR